MDLFISFFFRFIKRLERVIIIRFLHFVRTSTSIGAWIVNLFVLFVVGEIIYYGNDITKWIFKLIKKWTSRNNYAFSHLTWIKGWYQAIWTRIRKDSLFRMQFSLFLFLSQFLFESFSTEKHVVFGERIYKAFVLDLLLMDVPAYKQWNHCVLEIV